MDTSDENTCICNKPSSTRFEDEEIASNIQPELDKIDKGLNMAMHFARLDEFQKDFLVEKVNLYNEI